VFEPRHDLVFEKIDSMAAVALSRRWESTGTRQPANRISRQINAEVTKSRKWDQAHCHVVLRRTESGTLSGEPSPLGLR
jgi:hypothetical protein